MESCKLQPHRKRNWKALNPDSVRLLKTTRSAPSCWNVPLIRDIFFWIWILIITECIQMYSDMFWWVDQTATPRLQILRTNVHWVFREPAPQLGIHQLTIAGDHLARAGMTVVVRTAIAVHVFDTKMFHRSGQFLQFQHDSRTKVAWRMPFFDRSKLGISWNFQMRLHRGTSNL